VRAFPAAWLFVPGDRPDRFVKAVASGAGAIILDLEDAVATDRKDEARVAVHDYLVARTAQQSQVAVRMNALSTVSGVADLVMLAGTRADYVILPKAECPQELALLGRVLANGGSPAKVLALVESARGVARAVELADSTPAMAALMFGAADYVGDLGRQVENFRPDFARATIVNAAASGGIAALDSPWFNVVDSEGLARDCRAAIDLGFHAKAAIHPAQVEAIAAVFAPSEEDLATARRYIAANVSGVRLIDGKMVDVAMLTWAKRIVAAAGMA